MVLAGDPEVGPEKAQLAFHPLSEDEVLKLVRHSANSLSIRRFWGKGERWKRKRERGEGEKRLTQMLLLEPSTPTQHRVVERSCKNK